MIAIPSGVQVIEKYPFRVGDMIVDILGKPQDWREVLHNLHNAKMYEILADHVFQLGEIGEKKIVCPKPEHKTEITSSKELRVFSVARNQVAIYRGKNADGAEIDGGEVYALASGDCPNLGIHDPLTGATVALHFNRENGLDNDILEKALQRFPKNRRSEMIATISLGIGPENFRHEQDNLTHGEKNKERNHKLISDYGGKALSPPLNLGKINLRYIAAKKLLRAGFQPENIYVDKIDTYSDSRFWSHRASQDPESPKYQEQGRNLVLVANLS